jgi:hypothetical protein
VRQGALRQTPAFRHAEQPLREFRIAHPDVLGRRPLPPAGCGGTVAPSIRLREVASQGNAAMRIADIPAADRTAR